VLLSFMLASAFGHGPLESESYDSDDPSRPHERPGAAPLIVLAEIVDGHTHVGPPREGFVPAPADAQRHRESPHFRTEYGRTDVKVVEVLSGTAASVGDTIAVSERSDAEWIGTPRFHGKTALFTLRAAKPSSHTERPMFQNSMPGSLIVFMPEETPNCGTVTRAYTNALSRLGVVAALFDPDVHTDVELLHYVPGKPVVVPLTDNNVCEMVRWSDFVGAVREDAKLHAPAPPHEGVE